MRKISTIASVFILILFLSACSSSTMGDLSVFVYRFNSVQAQTLLAETDFTVKSLDKTTSYTRFIGNEGCEILLKLYTVDPKKRICGFELTYGELSPEAQRLFVETAKTALYAFTDADIQDAAKALDELGISHSNSINRTEERSCEMGEYRLLYLPNSLGGSFYAEHKRLLPEADERKPEKETLTEFPTGNTDSAE